MTKEKFVPDRIYERFSTLHSVKMLTYSKNNNQKHRKIIKYETNEID